MSVFIDEAVIRVQSGDGGNGCISFHREKYIPKGGPDGGDGGNGGSIIICSDKNKHTLRDFYYRPIYKTKRGRDGEGNNKHGRSEKDKIILVPVGSIIKDKKTGDIIADLNKDKMCCIVAQGGRGGVGNAKFATSTNQTPRKAIPGTSGEEKLLKIELKLISDVGLIGLPNAGKSTLISKISSARPKIAAYPFTTLIPQLGVVVSDDYSSFVVADIPGLIRGAHEGSGLGDRFLRHIEKSRILVHLIDISIDNQSDPVEDLLIINLELAQYSEALGKKSQVIVGTKMDRESKKKSKQLEDYCKEKKLPFFLISAQLGDNLDQLVDYLKGIIAAEKEPL